MLYPADSTVGYPVKYVQLSWILSFLCQAIDWSFSHCASLCSLSLPPIYHLSGYVGAHLSSSTRMKASALLCEFSILNLHFRLSWRFSSTKFKFPICRSALCLRFVKPFRILISFFSFALSRYSLMNSLLNENNKKKEWKIEEKLKENERNVEKLADAQHD